MIGIRIRNATAALLGLFPGLLFAALPGPAVGHDFGITRVTGIVSANSLDLTVHLNQTDVLELILATGSGRQAFDSLWEARAARPQVEGYVLSRILVTSGGTPLTGSLKGQWPPADMPLTGMGASGELIANPLPMTLSYAIPPGATKLGLVFTLYGESDFVPLVDLTLAARESGWTRTAALKANQTFGIDLADIRSAGTRGASRETDGSAWSVLFRFIGLGFTHIIPLGIDHILFVIGLFLLAPGIKPLLKQVTAFTLAHSMTLALAMLGIVSLPSRIVEPVIALSISVIAFENVFSRKMNRGRWLIVFLFGLVHGLGFAGVLSHLTLPDGKFLPALLGFNAGVELGQLAVILAAGALTWPVSRRSWYPRYVVVPASLAIGAVGLYWAVQRIAG